MQQLKKENEFLKNELRETRSIINNILNNISRQNHSCESITTNLDESWKIVPERQKTISKTSLKQMNKNPNTNGIDLKNRFYVLSHVPDTNYMEYKEEAQNKEVINIEDESLRNLSFNKNKKTTATRLSVIPKTKYTDSETLNEEVVYIEENSKNSSRQSRPIIENKRK